MHTRAAAARQRRCVCRDIIIHVMVNIESVSFAPYVFNFDSISHEKNNSSLKFSAQQQPTTFLIYIYTILYTYTITHFVSRSNIYM